jgi:hypothetical protein
MRHGGGIVVPLSHDTGSPCCDLFSCCCKVSRFCSGLSFLRRYPRSKWRKVRMLFFVGMRFKRAGELQKQQKRTSGSGSGSGRGMRSTPSEEKMFSNMANFILPNRIDTDIATLSKEACEWFVSATESSQRALVRAAGLLSYER